MEVKVPSSSFLTRAPRRVKSFLTGKAGAGLTPKVSLNRGVAMVMDMQGRF